MFDAATGQKKILLKSDVLLEVANWLPDDIANLILSSSRTSNFNRAQIGIVPYLQGVFRPNGKDLAFQTQSTSGGAAVIKILDFQTLQPLKTIERDPRAQGEIRYTPDGKYIGYPIRDKGLHALWISPVDGSPGRRVTEFAADRIDDFHWSPDGRKLVVLHAHNDSDVMLVCQTASMH